MDLNKLRIFHAVAEAGSFSAAGRLLYLSQPSVSAHIKDLEREVGVALFERLRRGARLTTAGDALASYARRIFALEADAGRMMAAHRGSETGRAVVAASSIPGTFLLPPILGRFHQAHPGVSLRLEISDTAEVERRLLELEADLGVMGEPISPGDLEVRPWVDDELVLIVVGDHPWTRRKPRRAEALAGRPFIAREPGSSVRALTDAWLAALGIQVDVTMELNSPEAVNRAVAAGLGVSITSRFALEHEVPSGELAIVNVPGLPIRRKLNVITNRHRPLLPATGALLQAILASGRTAAGIDSGVHL